MDKEALVEAAVYFVENSKHNYISGEIALSEGLVGMKIFDNPIFAFGSPKDEYFRSLKKASAIGNHFLLPIEWLSTSETIISIFLPFTNAIKESNKQDMLWPSEEWLHGYIEGQALIKNLCLHLKSKLINAGYDSVVPSLDERFWTKSRPSDDSLPLEISFTSNWSERHVAFACGLGTFGLSKGIITRKGMAGRLGSIITELPLSYSKREYKDIYEYCSMCGACIKNCPANAISMGEGKDHINCSKFLDITAGKYAPRNGCGKCQVGVPCESRIPS